MHQSGSNSLLGAVDLSQMHQCQPHGSAVFVVADFYMAAGVLSQSTGYGTQGFASIITKFVGEVEVQDANVTRRQGTS